MCNTLIRRRFSADAAAVTAAYVSCTDIGRTDDVANGPQPDHEPEAGDTENTDATPVPGEFGPKTWLVPLPASSQETKTTSA